MKLKLLTAFITLTAAATAGTTLQNLNHAYQGESNAANRYQQFARKADTENLKQTAKLFRAAAASEEIHRKIIERTILKIGGKVDTFKLDPITPATTAENLRSAIVGETAESGTRYPDFLATARADNEKSAIRAFHYALGAEKKHAEYFQQALDQIGGEVAITCYVCQDCGLLLTQLPAKKCPLCREGLKEFEIIN
ncbi:rubrerythrin family protein [bacterium]|nr:rubrerythrin family protein [bacterium]